MRSCQLSVRQRVVAIVKLSDVASKVLLNRELASRMNLLVAI